MIDEKEIQDWLRKIEEDEAAEKEEGERRKERRAFSVLHVDDRLIAVDKGPGVPTIPERNDTGGSLKTLVQEEFGRIWTVHRIDKDTSGVVVFARDAEAHRDLNEQFRDRQTGKFYAAFLEGELPEEVMEIDIPLATDTEKNGRVKPSAKGKEARTTLRLRELFRGFSYVEAELHTGRQHQIRVHARAIGLPLIVDPLYGNRDAFYLSSIKRKFRDYGRDEKPLVDRLTLHAERLVVRHPDTNEPITFTAELPKDLRALLTQLRKLRAR